MGLFEKKVTIFKKKDRETWQQIKDALKKEGFKGVSATHYFNDVVAAGGCGAKLDPRSFGGKGVADRDIYRIDVREEDRENVLACIRRAGLVAVVDDQAEVDAALRER